MSSGRAIELVLSTCTVDLLRRRVHHADGVFRLTANEVEVLARLTDPPGRTVTRAELEVGVWGMAPGVRSSAVPVAMRRLRAKVEQDPARPRHLHTVYGEGWTLTLPESPTSIPVVRLIGREDELRRLSGLQSRWITILGAPGVGKTQLALAWARQQVAVHLADVAHHVVVAGEVSERAIDEAVRGCLRLGTEVDVASALAQRGDRVLVLDGVDDRPQAVAARVERWLEHSPRLVVVVPTRRRTGHALEHVVRLGPLQPTAAVQLLRERAAAAGAALDADEELAALAAALDHLPAALELAAPLALVLGPAQLTLRALHGEPGTAVAEAFEWAWQALDEDARVVLASCALLVTPFGVERAEVVSGPDLDVASSLVQLLDHSLLVVHALRTFTVPRGLRELARSRLADPDAARARLRAHWLSWGEAQVAEFSTAEGPAVKARLAEVEPELAEACRGADAETETRLTLVRLPALEGRCRPARRVEILSALQPPDDLKVPVLVALAIARIAAGDTRHALGELRQVFELAPDHPRALRVLALCHLRDGRDEAALQAARRGLLHATEPANRGLLLQDLALAHRRRGESAEGHAALLESLAVVRASGSVLVEGLVLGRLADHYLESCQLEEAEATARRAVEVTQRNGSRALEGQNMAVLGLALAQQQRVGEAEEVLTEASDLLEELGEAPDAAVVYNHLADLYVEAGRLDEAGAVCARGLAQCVAPGLARFRATLLVTQAGISRCQGAPEAALRQLDEAAPIVRSNNLVFVVQATRGAVLADLGRVDEARKALAEAAPLAHTMATVGPAWLALCEAHLDWASHADLARVQRVLSEVEQLGLDSSDVRILAQLLRDRCLRT